MSAKDQMSKILDELMGQNRDGSDSGQEKHFTDRDVCRPFLLDICISDLFTNTRAELPDCTKVHSITMKDEYETASKTRDYRYEEEVLEYLRAFLADNDRKIETNRKRLDVTEDNPEMEVKGQEIHELAVQIGEKVSKAEAMGAEGKVDESLQLMKEVEEVKQKKKQAEEEYHALIPRHAVQQQKLKACEVCGAFLSMYDNDRRLADHFGGKLHIGFVTIREKIKQLEDKIKEKSEKRAQEREELMKERELEREREKEREKEKERERERDRDRGRRRSRSPRGRDGERERRRSHYDDRRRDSDRERRDSERERRDPERDRQRDRGGRDRGERRHKDHGRERERESRRRDRSRSR